MSLLNTESLLSKNASSTSRVPDKPADLTGPYRVKGKHISEFNTDLTTLKFGGDQAAGGWSGKPSNVPPIPCLRIPTSLCSSTYDLTMGPEVLSTDTGVGSSLPYYSQDRAKKEDVQRVKNFLDSKPDGSAFIRRQKELQLSNPITETSGRITRDTQNPGPFDKGRKPTPGILQNLRTFNDGKNLLAQVESAGTANRVIRSGDSLTTSRDYYANTVAKQFNMDPEELKRTNRLLMLKSTKLENTDPILYINNEQEANNMSRLGISPNNFLIRDYSGGPNSSYGLGNTTIARSENTAASLETQKILGVAKDIDGNPVVVNKVHSRINNTAIAKTYKEIANQPLNLNSNLNDFITGNEILSREQQYPVQETSKLPSKTTENPWGAGVAANDMISFGFEFVNNDSPSSGIFSQFRAYLSNGINDSYAGAYNNFRYLGRGEEFMTYQGYTRTLNFGFRIVAERKADLVSNFVKLEQLVSQVYPDYSAGGYMRSPLVRVTIGNYLYRVPGFLESINVTVQQETSWEINGPMQLPFHFDVDVTFKPIPEMMPVRNVSPTMAGILGSMFAAPSSPNQPNSPTSFTPSQATNLPPANFQPLENTAPVDKAALNKQVSKGKASSTKNTISLETPKYLKAPEPVQFGAIGSFDFMNFLKPAPSQYNTDFIKNSRTKQILIGFN